MTKAHSMKFRAVKFPGSACWHIQLSEPPAVIFDVSTVMLEGVEVFYLRKGYPSSDDAETAIKSLIDDWEMQAGEWQP